MTVVNKSRDLRTGVPMSIHMIAICGTGMGSLARLLAGHAIYHTILTPRSQPPAQMRSQELASRGLRLGDSHRGPDPHRSK